ncbi:hypothetical protein AGMMS49938_11110 [Fibrobacterales bacterium]|nr:hypothetical protein AGMMS49938_11110 [Fibrobacterales bacterium]
MKKLLSLFAVSALALVACKSTGSVSGTVIDPFTGKAVELPTVYVKGTTFSSQKIPGGLPDGTFKFEGIEEGTYTVEAGKGKYSKGHTEFTISKDAANAKADIYIYSQSTDPGLYRPVEGANAEKISARAIFQPICKETGIAFRTKFTVENPQTKKKDENVLPAPVDVPPDVTLLIKIATSVSSPIEATSYPILTESAKKHADCDGVDPKETLIVPNLSKGTVIPSAYKSENLYEIKGSLQSGKQILAIKQDGKLVNAYYINAK